MKKLGVLITLLLTIGGLTGCTIIREVPTAERQKQPKGAEFDLCRTLIKAFMKNDAAAFVKHVPDEARRTFGVRQFETTRKSVIESVGEPISFEYVTELELTENITPYIWKIRFRRVNEKSGKEFTSEILFKIVIGKLDKKPVMLSFQFL